MDVSFYLAPFLISFFLAIACILVLRGIFSRHPIADIRGDARHLHRKGVLRFGGVALILASLATVFMNAQVVLTMAWWGTIIVSVLILIIGLIDDVQEVSWKIQLFFQLAVGSISFAFGIRLLSIANPFGSAIFFDSGWMSVLSFVITVLWILTVMNAVNWADGVDGLSGGVAFIAFVTIFFLSLRPEVNQPPVAIFSLILAGSSLGFLLFNFYPARVFAGTSGSWFLGFMLAALALFSGTKIATSVSVLALPLLDALWVVFDRLHSKVSIFAPDQRHLHHRLLKIGWSPYAIALFFYAITAVSAVVALHTGALGKVISLCAIAFLTVVFFVRIQRRIVS